MHFCFAFNEWVFERDVKRSHKKKKEKMSKISLAQHGNTNILVAALDAMRLADIEAMCYIKIALSIVLK